MPAGINKKGGGWQEGKGQDSESTEISLVAPHPEPQEEKGLACTTIFFYKLIFRIAYTGVHTPMRGTGTFLLLSFLALDVLISIS